MVEKGAKNIYVPFKVYFHCRYKYNQLAQLAITLFGIFPGTSLHSPGLMMSCLKAEGFCWGKGRVRVLPIHGVGDWSCPEIRVWGHLRHAQGGKPL